MTERKKRLRTGAVLAILAVLALLALWCDINAGYRSISLEELGQIPKEGDSFVSDGVKVVVLKMDDHRVDKAKVYQNVQNNAENEGNQEK